MNLESKVRILSIIRSEKSDYTMIKIISINVSSEKNFEGQQEEVYFFNISLFDKLKGLEYPGKEATIKYHLESRGSLMKKVVDEIVIDEKNILE